MVKVETLENGYVKTYSTEGYEVRNIVNGDTFLEAIDNPAWGNTYEEVIPEPTDTGNTEDNQTENDEFEEGD